MRETDNEFMENTHNISQLDVFKFDRHHFKLE